LRTNVAGFFISSQDAPQKTQFFQKVGAMKKLASLVLWRQNAKWPEISTELTVTGPKYF